MAIIFFGANNSLLALEIRLHSPSKVYLKDGFVCVDVEMKASVLPSEIEEYLKYGIPVYFNYFIYFYQNNFFFDKPLKKVVFRKKVEYDVWSKVYFLECKQSKRYPKKIIGLSNLRKEITFLKEVKVVRYNTLNPQKSYYFKTRMGLIIKHSFSPFYQFFFSFFSVFKYKTTFFESPLYSYDALKN